MTYSFDFRQNFWTNQCVRELLKLFSSVDTLYAFFLVEVTRFLKKQLVGSAFLLALLKLLIAMTAKTLKDLL